MIKISKCIRLEIPDPQLPTSEGAPAADCGNLDSGSRALLVSDIDDGASSAPSSNNTL